MPIVSSFSQSKGRFLKDPHIFVRGGNIQGKRRVRLVPTYHVRRNDRNAVIKLVKDLRFQPFGFLPQHQKIPIAVALLPDSRKAQLKAFACAEQLVEMMIVVIFATDLYFCRTKPATIRFFGANLAIRTHIEQADLPAVDAKYCFYAIEQIRPHVHKKSLFPFIAPGPPKFGPGAPAYVTLCDLFDAQIVEQNHRMHVFRPVRKPELQLSFVPVSVNSCENCCTLSDTEPTQNPCVALG